MISQMTATLVPSSFTPSPLQTQSLVFSHYNSPNKILKVSVSGFHPWSSFLCIVVFSFVSLLYIGSCTHCMCCVNHKYTFCRLNLLNEQEVTTHAMTQAWALSRCVWACVIFLYSVSLTQSVSPFLCKAFPGFSSCIRGSMCLISGTWQCRSTHACWCWAWGFGYRAYNIWWCPLGGSREASRLPLSSHWCVNVRHLV